MVAPLTSAAWQSRGIASEHVTLLMPMERDSLGREIIGNIERCYNFVNRATDKSLPRRIFITVDWNQSRNRCDWQKATILVGMDRAVEDIKERLFYSTAKEIARMGLLGLSQGAQREDTEFLFEGMIEILVHEYSRTSRRLEAAWIHSKYLDEMEILRLQPLRAWSDFSDGKRNLRNASPGITFLTTFRVLQGRNQPMKLFKALRKKSLTDSLSEAFNAPIEELEATWLKQVREYPFGDEITPSADDIPQLVRTKITPEKSVPGSGLQLQFFIEDRARNLLSSGVFFRDQRTGRLFTVQSASEEGADYFGVTLPIEMDCPPGEYAYQVTAIDESGNLRQWSGKYTVASRQ